MPCAVKIARGQAGWTRWIYREAVALARVKHPLLPAVLEVGQLEGVPYLVMDRVEGTTLAEHLSRGALDEPTVMGVAHQLASVLGALHDAGLVHRDVKPQNIVIEKLGGELKLVDFGFATPIERVGVTAAGTIAYAAPEQLSPAGHVDARSDLYAVGRVLFECLVPRALQEPTPGPWGADARARLVTCGVATALADIVAGLLQRSPLERYPSAGALASELDRFARGAAVLGPAGYEPRRTAGRGSVRDAERDHLLASMRRLRDRGGVLLVRGGRGSGKTRLLGALVDEARISACTLHVACQKDDPPLATLRRLLESYCEGLGEEASEPLREAIGNMAPLVQLMAPRRMTELLRLAPVASHEMATASDSLVEGAAEILVRLAGHRGRLVLAIDDAQWIDPASSEALVRVGHRTAESPVVLVLAGRPAPPGPLERFVGVNASATTDMTLRPLTLEEAGRLVAAHLGETEVDPTIAARVHAMADGTPLGVLEVLGAFLDEGAVRPRGAWIFDAEAASKVSLPPGALALLGRRLRELPEATLHVLEAAAIFGTTFEDAALARAVGQTASDLATVLAAPRRAGLLETGEAGQTRFLHDSLTEMLIEGLTEATRRRLHQRAAEALDGQAEPSFETLCAAARHYAAGETEKTPRRAYEIARRAGEAAIQRFDNETALCFLKQACAAAEAASIPIETSVFRGIGEAQLRIGALDESLAAFESALARAHDAPTRAVLLGRISWLHQTRADPEQAWAQLQAAFAALGERLPVEDVTSATTTTAHFAGARLRRLRGALLRARSPATREAPVDLLCDLHYQNARLAFEYEKPARALQSTVYLADFRDRSSVPRTQARALAFHGLMLLTVGRRGAAERELTAAEEIAARHGDSAVKAFCVQMQCVAAGWGGDVERADALAREAIETHGPWLEMSEYCQVAMSGELGDVFRGRPLSAWKWVRHVLDRLRRSGKRPRTLDWTIQRARAAMAELGRTAADDPWLEEQLATVSPRDPGTGFHRLVSWGARARYFAEVDPFGQDLEELIRAFAAEGHNPRRVHIAVVELYLAIGHVRVHQILRGAKDARAARLDSLRWVVGHLRVFAKRLSLFRAHLRALEGYLSWFDGDARAAEASFAEAEQLAHAERSPWVLYAVARGRAHLLRADGHGGRSADQAALAIFHAESHGSRTRARWIHEELGAPGGAHDRDGTGPSGSAWGPPRRTLAAFLRLVHAPRRKLALEPQAGAILDELLEVVGAERGALRFHSEAGAPVVIVARSRRDATPTALPASTLEDVLLRVHRSRSAWPASGGAAGARDDRPPFDRLDHARTLALPLLLFEEPVGALLVERAPREPPLGEDDRSLLQLIAGQIPVALETARLLSERDALQASAQHAEKMEALGALAGGLAHDFGNMVVAIRLSLAAARAQVASAPGLVEQLDVIDEATARAAELVSQLLSFSRREPMPLAAHSVNELVTALMPMLRRIVGPTIQILANLAPSLPSVEVDASGFDHALVNLCINARDAIAGPGKLTITTHAASLDEASAQRLDLPAGEYVELAITDDGPGIDADTLARIFEPFFTTKPTGRATGLGLARVYSFAKSSGGAVEASSERGRGATFRLYLRTAGTS